VAQATDGLAEVLGFELVRGRWFEDNDSALGWTPVVINLALARETFGEEDPIGKTFLSGDERRVVGVITEFRKGGEFWTPANFLWERQSLEDPESTPYQNLLIKVRPETTAAFEEEILARLQPIAPGWSIKVQPLAHMREAAMKDHLLPLLGGGILAGFLLLMVALGLIGVLWQNVTQRTRELGLRRAAGANAKQIHRQILTEMSLITTLGVVLGSITVIQLPLLDMMASSGAQVYAACLVGCAAIIYVLALLCGLYPSWLATRVQPAEALHYE
jgi:putative ABC transport system permease protein